MRALALAGLAGLLTFTLAAAQDKSPLKSQQDKVSYSIGLNIGRNLKGQGIEVAPDALIKGVRDVMEGNPPLLSDEEIRMVMFAFQMEQRARQQERSQQAGERNKREGEAFLARNRQKPGVTTAASGLQYKVITEGTGKSPSVNDTVTAHYKGTLIDGTVFDSSYDRGEPARISVSGVIPGWTEALQMMQVGAKWVLWIPAQLAYGERGAGQHIGPNTVLIFEIELIAIE